MELQETSNWTLQEVKLLSQLGKYALLLFCLISAVSGYCQRESGVLSGKGILGDWHEKGFDTTLKVLTNIREANNLIYKYGTSCTLSLEEGSFEISEWFENKYFLMGVILVEDNYVNYFVLLSKDNHSEITPIILKEYWQDKRMDLVFIDGSRISEVLILESGKLHSTIRTLKGELNVLFLLKEHMRVNIDQFGLSGFKLTSQNISSLDYFIKVPLSKKYSLLHGLN
jgi:hypothetical protein